MEKGKEGNGEKRSCWAKSVPEKVEGFGYRLCEEGLTTDEIAGRHSNEQEGDGEGTLHTRRNGREKGLPGKQGTGKAERGRCVSYEGCLTTGEGCLTTDEIA